MLALGAGTLPATASPAPSPAPAHVVRVAVTTDRYEFADTTWSATYAVACARRAGACPRVRADDSVDVRRREVRRARLGFDADRASARTAVTGPAAWEQEESVVVRLRRSGRLDVTLTGTNAGGADATPVAGSASSGGDVSGRTVRWELGHRARGTYTFTARFRVAADPAKVGGYATRATVERTDVGTRTLLDHAWGTQRAPRGVRRVSALTFASRVTPPYGPPRGRADRWRSTRDEAGLPYLFSTTVSADAYGAYSPSASGLFGHTTTLDLRKAAPGALRDEMSFGLMTGGYSIGLEEKFIPNGGFAYEDDGPVTGLTAAVCAYDGVPGALLYDGDALTASFLGDVYMTAARRRGGPRGDRGRLGPAWNGRLVSMWGAESQRSVLDPGGAPYRWADYLYGTTVGWTVRGGDLDNRDGDRAVRGDGITARVPAGERIGFAFSSTSILNDTEMDIVGGFRGDSAFTLRADVGPGGYWLRSTRKGYVRDWSTSSSLLIGAAPPDPDLQPAVTALRVVPPGTRSLVQYHVPGQAPRKLLLDAGTWSVRVADGVLSALPVAADGTSGC